MQIEVFIPKFFTVPKDVFFLDLTTKESIFSAVGKVNYLEKEKRHIEAQLKSA